MMLCAGFKKMQHWYVCILRDTNGQQHGQKKTTETYCTMSAAIDLCLHTLKAAQNVFSPYLSSFPHFLMSCNHRMDDLLCIVARHILFSRAK